MVERNRLNPIFGVEPNSVAIRRISRHISEITSLPYVSPADKKDLIFDLERIRDAAYRLDDHERGALLYHLDGNAEGCDFFPYRLPTDRDKSDYVINLRHLLAQALQYVQDPSPRNLYLLNKADMQENHTYA